MKTGTWSVHTKDILLLGSRLRNNQDRCCLVISCLITNKGHVNSTKRWVNFSHSVACLKLSVVYLSLSPHKYFWPALANLEFNCLSASLSGCLCLPVCQPICLCHPVSWGVAERTEEKTLKLCIFLSPNYKRRGVLAVRCPRRTSSIRAIETRPGRQPPYCDVHYERLDFNSNLSTKVTETLNQ